MAAAYDEHFYARIGGGSRRSARAVCRLLQPILAPASVLDVGCGDGGWLAAWGEAGVPDLRGLDGGHVDPASLQVPPARFTAADLAAPFDLGRRFDLVQSLEVAEHLPPASAGAFVEALARHGDVVLFSAAPPGQVGLHHVNERPYQYWRALFQARGFACHDLLRPALREAREVEPWYRYNAFLYVRTGAPAAGHPALQASRVPDGQPLRDTAPAAWRARRAALRLLPGPVATLLSQLSARFGRRGP